MKRAKKNTDENIRDENTLIFEIRTVTEELFGGSHRPGYVWKNESKFISLIEEVAKLIKEKGADGVDPRLIAAVRENKDRGPDFWNQIDLVGLSFRVHLTSPYVAKKPNPFDGLNI